MRIITTVGTSIFTNYKNEHEVIRNYPGLKRDYENITTQYDNLNERLNDKGKKENIPASEYTNSRYQGDIEHIREVIQYLWLAEAQEKSCAELQTLYKIVEEEQAEEFELYLLATDTVLSVLAAELIRGYLEEQTSIRVKEIKVIEGLQIDNATKFRTDGLKNLVAAINNLNETEQRVILNISGGYKALIPFITLIGQIEQIPLYYMYEDSRELIIIGKMPFSFDWTLIEGNVTYLFDNTFINNEKIKQNLINLGLIDNNKELTTLGNLAKAYLENENIPFQATTIGYLIEYKLYEYFQKNTYKDFSKVSLGQKLSNEEGKDLEDADLWLENNNCEVIIGEIKSASNSPKSLRKKIKKLLNFDFVKSKIVKEFWLIVYEYEGSEVNNDEDWCNQVINGEIQYLFQGIIFKIKKVKVAKNVIDGNRNRMIYQEFLRSSVENIDELFTTKSN